ncbi:hypothetical protein CBR_g29933 [Chara braunii]|uniref:Uncharacterized protein n=1 Tax=Chara braunii TaxID=69332 RepID=A0A388JX06_CHABU|nr:hypothetical protein CBR_g29933 [Chara braunii]|eukprot:GBG62326.1 hypothetical protein CBR_g29933 [Chara braunii]
MVSVSASSADVCTAVFLSNKFPTLGNACHLDVLAARARAGHRHRQTLDASCPLIAARSDRGCLACSVRGGKEGEGFWSPFSLGNGSHSGCASQTQRHPINCCHGGHCSLQLQVLHTTGRREKGPRKGVREGARQGATMCIGSGHDAPPLRSRRYDTCCILAWHVSSLPPLPPLVPPRQSPGCGCLSSRPSSRNDDTENPLLRCGRNKGRRCSICCASSSVGVSIPMETGEDAGSSQGGVSRTRVQELGQRLGLGWKFTRWHHVPSVLLRTLSRKSGVSEKRAAWGKKFNKGGSDLSADRPLPLPMTFPDSEPISPEEVDKLLQCDPEVEASVT